MWADILTHDFWSNDQNRNLQIKWILATFDIGEFDNIIPSQIWFHLETAFSYTLVCNGVKVKLIFVATKVQQIKNDE